MSFTIRRATYYEDKHEWLRMRHGLWPEAPLDYLASDTYLAGERGGHSNASKAGVS
jgi:hypothetical protein